MAFSGLPLVLQPEEISVLLSEGVIETVRASSVIKPSRETSAQFEQFRDESYKQQVRVCRDERAVQIRQMADKIVEGKKRKLRAEQQQNIESKKLKTEPVCDEINAEEIIQNELNKIRDFPPQNVLIQTFNGKTLLAEISYKN